MARRRAVSSSLARSILRGLGVADASIGEDVPPLGFLPSGLDCLDMAIGVPGYPQGRLVLVHGPAGVGKTTLCLIAIREAQKRGGLGLYLDFERKLSIPWAKHLGVDTKELIVWPAPPAPPPKGEEVPLLPFPSIEAGFDLVVRVLQLVQASRRDAPVAVVWDSLHAPESRTTIDEGMDEPGYAGMITAKAYGRCWKQIIPVLANTGAVLFAISQVRTTVDGRLIKEKIGVGSAVNFHASLTLVLSQKAVRGVGDRDGDKVRVVVAKNQIAAPWKSTHYTLRYETGIDTWAATLEAAQIAGLADEPAGGWTRLHIAGLDRPVKVQGSMGGPKSLEAWAEANPDTWAVWHEAVRASIGKAPVAEAEPEEIIEALPEELTE